MEDFIWRALFAALGLAVVSGTMGCFVIWRRMAYFGDSLAHSAVLGIGLGLIWGVNLNITIGLVCLLFAFLLSILHQKKLLAIDSLLGIFAHTALAIGFVIINAFGNVGFDLHHYLFGDILTVSAREVWWIYCGSIFALGMLVANWQSLILMSLNEDLAKSEGINTQRMHFLMMVVMTVIVAVSSRVVGVLLITSLLVIPAAAARTIAQSPITMAIWATIIGVLACLFGLGFSVWFDWPSGPSIVIMASCLFVLLLFVHTSYSWFHKT